MDYLDNMQEDTSSNTILTDEELDLCFQTARVGEDYWGTITRAQDTKTTRLLIEDIEKLMDDCNEGNCKLAKRCDFFTSDYCVAWQLFKKLKGISK